MIGLALIVLFGRSGAVNALPQWAFDIGPRRWIYGLPGVWLAQTLALTPVAFLVLVGISRGIGASLEEGAQTLRASAPRTFDTVTLPLTTPASSTRSLSCSSKVWLRQSSSQTGLILVAASSSAT